MFASAPRSSICGEWRWRRSPCRRGGVAGRKAFEQRRARRAVGDLAAREHEGDRSAERVGQRVDFRRPPAARAADRLIFLPPFPPAAERCAFTADESMRTCAGGPPACARPRRRRPRRLSPPIGRSDCRASSSAHSPAARPPTAARFRTCTMPLITRRSSTRALPRVSVGRCGATSRTVPRVSQNWSRFIDAPFRKP